MKLLRNQRMYVMRPIHPGEVLKEELAEIGVTTAPDKQHAEFLKGGVPRCLQPEKSARS